MISFNFEYVLGNLSFASLFATVIWYWVRVVFSLSPSLHFIGTFGMTIANLSLTGVLMSRWLASGHFPLSNLFESLLFLSWGFTAFHLALERVSKADFIGVTTSPMAFLTNAFASFTLPHEMQKATALIPALQSNWLMMHVTIMMISYVALISGSLLAIAFLVVNYFDGKKRNPVPRHRAALWPPIAIKPLSREATLASEGFPQSDAAQLAKIMAILAKHSLGEGQRAGSRYQADLRNPAAAYQGQLGMFVETYPVAASRGLDSMPSGVSDRSQQESLPCSQLPVLSPLHQLPERHLQKVSDVEEVADLSPFAQALDNLSYRTLGLGFPLLTIGIASGAVWANEAWGSYWSWDPKETWAFITWLVFAIYLHTRLGKGWKGTRPAAIAAAGFFVVWICYLGVNLLGIGLHSYGWLRSGG